MNWVNEKWMEGREDKTGDAFKAQFLSEWPIENDAVYKREEVSRWLADGRIDEKEADRLLRLRYKVNRKGEKVIVDEDS